jgi:predicted alpha/beta superfamily hydrolase
VLKSNKNISNIRIANPNKRKYDKTFPVLYMLHGAGKAIKSKKTAPQRA